jgi:putative GTP pyrophosphokinase
MDKLQYQTLDDIERLRTAVGPDRMEHALQKTLEFARLMTYYRCAMMEIETKFKVLNEEFSLRFDRQPINSITTRLKNPLSIQEKLVHKGLPLSLESIERDLHDIAGIRVVCSFIEDVYMLADALLKQDDITLIEKKDYIADPKPNGYRSLHLIVEVPIFLEHEKRMMKAEIQLRTIAMDSWACMEHQLRYKKDDELDIQIAEEIQACAELSATLDRKMNWLKNQIASESPDDSFKLHKEMERIRSSLSRTQDQQKD